MGGIVVAAVLAVIASGASGFSIQDSSFAANGFGDSSGGYSLLAALVCKVVLTGVFLIVIMSATRKGALIVPSYEPRWWATVEV